VQGGLTARIGGRSTSIRGGSSRDRMRAADALARGDSDALERARKKGVKFEPKQKTKGGGVKPHKASPTANRERRIRLAEILNRAGYNPYKVLNAIRFPVPTGFSFRFRNSGSDFDKGEALDDDFALFYSCREAGDDTNTGSLNEIPGANLQRNAAVFYSGWGAGDDTNNEGVPVVDLNMTASVSNRGFNLNEGAKNNYRKGRKSKEKILHCGLTKIKIDTFDGWPKRWQNRPWIIQFTYSDNTTNETTGGNLNSGISSIPLPDPIPPDYYSSPPKIIDYYDNGYSYVPSARNWRLPDFLTPSETLTK